MIELRELSILELAELRQRLHRELHGASSAIEYALAAFCSLVGEEQEARGGRPLMRGCPACATTLRAGLTSQPGGTPT